MEFDIKKILIELRRHKYVLILIFIVQFAACAFYIVNGSTSLLSTKITINFEKTPYIKINSNYESTFQTIPYLELKWGKNDYYNRSNRDDHFMSLLSSDLYKSFLTKEEQETLTTKNRPAHRINVSYNETNNSSKIEIINTSYGDGIDQQVAINNKLVKEIKFLLNNNNEYTKLKKRNIQNLKDIKDKIISDHDTTYIISVIKNNLFNKKKDFIEKNKKSRELLLRSLKNNLRDYKLNYDKEAKKIKTITKQTLNFYLEDDKEKEIKKEINYLNNISEAMKDDEDILEYYTSIWHLNPYDIEKKLNSLNKQLNKIQELNIHYKNALTQVNNNDLINEETIKIIRVRDIESVFQIYNSNITMKNKHINNIQVINMAISAAEKNQIIDKNSYNAVLNLSLKNYDNLFHYNRNLIDNEEIQTMYPKLIKLVEKRVPKTDILFDYDDYKKNSFIAKFGLEKEIIDYIERRLPATDKIITNKLNDYSLVINSLDSYVKNINTDYHEITVMPEKSIKRGLYYHYIIILFSILFISSCFIVIFIGKSNLIRKKKS